MSFSMSIHPDRKWKTVQADLYGNCDGQCIAIVLDFNILAIHYGEESDKKEFILKLKEAIDNLPSE